MRGISQFLAEAGARARLGSAGMFAILPPLPLL